MERQISPEPLEVNEDRIASDEAPWRDPNARLYDAAQSDAAAAQADAAQQDRDQAVSAAATVEAEEEAQAPRERLSRVAAVVRRIAELETAERAEASQRADPAVGPKVPEMNEDEIEAVPPSGPAVETIQWEDHVSAGDSAAATVAEDDQTLENAQALAQEAAEDVALEALDAEDGFLDEDSLRDLVADIVREELQGPLGERITRNVRKLVRREIQRALAAQDLI
ncbi:hypothetical protein [Phaeobacter sp. B1627]|uniref:hypothetical protein n=1 Tax=Phaeobacter sp. B1627 TaxID=2583809 RepID=UPI00111946BE|nr:hypothetical protein [Phaeobacter sp. B1627]TNJ48557.1 hypothetical protein FGE21_01000 [Phaeobacter sp. B1627]